MGNDERRRLARIALRVPVHVEGHDPGGAPWTEMTTTQDASARGVSLSLKHKISKGALVHLSLPLPQRLRRYDPVAPSYRVFGLVRTVKPNGKGSQVGVVFLGAHPPKDHDRHPGMLYLMPGDKMPTEQREERRSSRRLDLQMDVRLRRLETNQEERTVTENLSRRGLRAPTTLPVSKGEIVEIEEVWGPFRARAEIRNVYIGKDNVPRLNIRFLDEDIPARLLPDAG